MWYHSRGSTAKRLIIITIFRIIYSNMQIISLNMHDKKMSQAEMDSTRKSTPGSVEKSLVVTIIKLLQHLPCLQPITHNENSLHSVSSHCNSTTLVFCLFNAMQNAKSSCVRVSALDLSDCTQERDYQRSASTPVPAGLLDPYPQVRVGAGNQSTGTGQVG